MFDQIKPANHALEIPFTRHGAERWAHRVKRDAYLHALMGCGSINQRGQIRAHDLHSLVAEARAEGDYDTARKLEKIHNLVVVCGRRGVVITSYRDRTKRYRDPREQRRRLQQAEVDRRRQVGR